MMLKINEQTTLLSIFVLVASCSFLQAGFRGIPYSTWSPWVYSNNTAPQFSLALPIAIEDDVRISAQFVQLKGVHVRGTITIDGRGLGCGADKPTTLLLSFPLDMGVKGREIADCKYRTIIHGDIIFVGSPGVVVVEEGATFIGEVTNGTIVRHGVVQDGETPPTKRGGTRIIGRDGRPAGMLYDNDFNKELHSGGRALTWR